MRNIFGIILQSLILCLAIGQDVRAQKADKQPLQEVFQTDLVYPQEKGEIQFTVASSIHRLGASKTQRVLLVMEYGLTDKWQVELEWDAFAKLRNGEGRANNGIGDGRIGVKRSFMNLRNSNFHAAVGLELGLPLGDVNRDLGEGVIGFEPFVIVAKDFPGLRRLQVFTQVGVEFVHKVRLNRSEEAEPSPNEFSWNSGFFIPVGTMCFTTEINWSTNRWNKGGRDDQRYFTPGIVFELPMSWELGAGVALGLNGRSDSSRIIVKLTHEFGSSDNTPVKTMKN